MTLLETELKKAPLFSAVDHDNQPFHLESHVGNSWILLWFWPNAPMKGGCGHNLGRCGKVFRQTAHILLEQRQCRVVGVNYNDPMTNWLWGGAEDNLPFYLVSDETKEIAELYGVKRGPDEDWQDLPRRRAFLIDPGGNIRRQWTIIHGSDFVDEVFETLAELKRD